MIDKTSENELDSARMGELYLPCVMSRLVDQNPETRVERYPHAVSLAGLRQSVLDNVSLILNASSRPPPSELQDDPEIMASVLGMGLENFCGVSHGREQRERLRREILRQLKLFEPRLDSRVTEVTYVADEANLQSGELDIEIRSLISVPALKEELAFRARLSLESGEALLDETPLNT